MDFIIIPISREISRRWPGAIFNRLRIERSQPPPSILLLHFRAVDLNINYFTMQLVALFCLNNKHIFDCIKTMQNKCYFRGNSEKKDFLQETTNKIVGKLAKSFY